MATNKNAQNNSSKNSQMASKMVEAGVSIDINQIDVTKLDNGALMALMQKLNEVSQQRDEEIKKEFMNYIETEVGKLKKRISDKYGDLYYDIQVSFEKKPEIVERESDKVPDKFQNPNNPSEKWTGRGQPKSWVSKYIKEKGISLDTFKSSTDGEWVIKTQETESA